MLKDTIGAPTHPALTIISYNIAGGHKDTFWRDWDSHVQELVDVMAKEQPDVVCLQEVFGFDDTNTQAHKIANKLRMSCVFGRATSFPPPKLPVYGNAILSRFPIHTVKPIPLPHGSVTRDDGTRMPGSLEPRLALSAIISPYKNQPEMDFLCICTHFGIYTKGDPSKKEPIFIIKQFLNSETHIHQMPALLVGDFNFEPNCEMWQLLNEKWNMYPPDGGTVEPTCGRMKIDYVCDRGRGQYVMQQPHIVIQSTTSDHLPLVARWQPKK